MDSGKKVKGGHPNFAHRRRRGAQGAPPRMAVISNRRWVAFVLGREALLLWFCFLGSWLFLNHGLLYLQPRVELVNAPPQAYALTTAVIYIFIRGISLVVETRAPPRVTSGTSHRREEVDPAAVQPVRRIVRTLEPAGDPKRGILLRNAVASAQAVLPAGGKKGPTPLSALPEEHQGEAPVPRPTKEPWRPSWMSETPKRR